MVIRAAQKREYPDIRAFYHNVIDLMQDAPYKPAWEKGVYPSDSYLKEAIENGELWVCEYENAYAAAMIVNHKSNEGYQKIKWSTEAETDEVTVVHALCVLPTLQGKGIAGAMVRKVLELAQIGKRKAVRLDVLGGNIPAEKLYVKYGFQYIDTIEMFYEDTGWTNFKLYEYKV